MASSARTDVSWTKEKLEKEVRKLHSPHFQWSYLKGTALGTLKKSAVLIPLVVKSGELFVWLTLRAAHMRNDAGHVAFPGGKKDDEDADEFDTCLRESREEIGLESHLVNTLAVLPPRITARQLLVSPVVGIVSPEFVPDPNYEEVSDVFMLPLSRFLQSRGHSSMPYSFRGLEMNLHYFVDDVDGKQFMTWGLTAIVCAEVAVALLQQLPDFMHTPHRQISLQDPFSAQKEYLTTFTKQQGKL